MFTKKVLPLASCLGLALTFDVAAAPTLSFEERDILNVGWSADYLGCVYDETANTATYSYAMTVLSDEKDLSHWVLGIPHDLVPVGSSGGVTTEIGLDLQRGCTVSNGMTARIKARHKPTQLRLMALVMKVLLNMR